MTFVHVHNRAHPDNYNHLLVLHYGEDNTAVAVGNLGAGVGHKSGLTDG